MKRFAVWCAVSVASVGVLAPSVQAMSEFKKAFQEKYVDKSGNEAFKAAFQKASCNVCHLKGKKKEERNDYGKELAELIEGNATERLKVPADQKDKVKADILKELEKAFDEVAKKKSASGETYGNLIQAGQLPFTQ
jgi:hypothetical protein